MIIHIYLLFHIKSKENKLKMNIKKNKNINFFLMKINKYRVVLLI